MEFELLLAILKRILYNFKKWAPVIHRTYRTALVHRRILERFCIFKNSNASYTVPQKFSSEKKEEFFGNFWCRSRLLTNNQSQPWNVRLHDGRYRKVEREGRRWWQNTERPHPIHLWPIRTCASFCVALPKTIKLASL